jgi:S-adenosylmethionine:tRNA ribosyltransferase-isomerase
MLLDLTMQNPDLLLASYDFNLPDELIAQRPIAGRHHSKLLVYYAQEDRVEHKNYTDLPKILSADNLLVFNQSKVFPCRLMGHKPSGGKCEVFVLSLLDNDGIYPAMIKTSGKKKIGDEYTFGDLQVKIIDTVSDGSFLIKFNLKKEALLDFLQLHAKIPIPPYIRGAKADEKDKDDYQTVYAKEVGSVAAPTAGLHFTHELLENLKQQGIEQAFVTLHVGAGTFKPVTTDSILDHKMHSEFFHIDQENLKLIQSYPKKIVAVGTTSLRVLESCSDENGNISFDEDGLCQTDIFLHPGVPVNSISALITNFHLPKSSLLMLVSSIIGRSKALELYKIAIENKYRFFSYGDGMILIR